MYIQRKDLVFVNRRNKRAIAMKEIVMLRGYSNYTHFYLQNGGYQITAHTLKYYEEQLLENGFLRVHRAVIINKEFVIAKREDAVEMSNGEEIEIARRRKCNVSRLLNK